MAMDSTDLTIHESEDEDVYVSVEKNIEITKHGNRQHTPVSSFCFFFFYIYIVLCFAFLLYNNNFKERALQYDN